MAYLRDKGPGISLSGGGTIATWLAANASARANLGRSTGKWKFKMIMRNPPELSARTHTGGGFMTSAGLLTATPGQIPGSPSDPTMSTVLHTPLNGFVWYEAHWYFKLNANQFLINYLRCSEITFAIDCDATKYWICCRTLTGDGAPYDSGWLSPIGIPGADPTFLAGYDYGAGGIEDTTIYPFVFSDYVGAQVELDFAPGVSDQCSADAEAAGFMDWDTTSGFTVTPRSWLTWW